MVGKANKACVATGSGSYRFVNLYWKDDGAVDCGASTYPSLDAARGNRLQNGTYICTIQVTTKVEVA